VFGAICKNTGIVIIIVNHHHHHHHHHGLKPASQQAEIDQKREAQGIKKERKKYKT
jgi:hypothetical protein